MSTVIDELALNPTSITTHVAELADGRFLSYSDCGPAGGVAVMLCHGLPGARLIPGGLGRSLLDELDVRIIIPDRPGFGLSDFKPERTVLDTAEDIAELGDLLGITSIRVLGVSAGAPYALACCVALADRIERAGIISGITPMDAGGILHTALPQPLLWLARHSRLTSRAVHRLLVYGMRNAPERALESIKRTLAPSDRVVLERPDVAEYFRAITLEAAHLSARGWAYDDWLLNRSWGFSPSDIPATVPVDLWWGAEDLAVPIEHGRQLAQEIPQARLTVVDHYGHFGLMLISESIREVLSQLCQ